LSTRGVIMKAASAGKQGGRPKPDFAWRAHLVALAISNDALQASTRFTVKTRPLMHFEYYTRYKCAYQT